jgi:hypothetical protein
MPPKKKTQTESAKKYVPSVKLRDVRGTVPYTIAGVRHLNDVNPLINTFVKPAEKNKKTLQEPYTIVSVDVSAGLLHVAELAEPVPIHMKTVHILHPKKLMKTGEGRVDQDTPVFWTYGHGDIHFEHNKAYTEAVAFHLTSIIGEDRKIPHYTRWYGSVRGLADVYRYDMDEEFESNRFTRWFWANYEAGMYDLDIRPRDTNERMSREEILAEFKPDEDMLTDTEVSTIGDESEDVDEDMVGDGDMDDVMSVESLDCVDICAGSANAADAESVCSFNIDDLASAPQDSPIELVKPHDSTSHKPYSETDGLSEEEPLWKRYYLHALIPRMPVVISFLERHEGAMDNLMDEDEESTLIDEDKWTAWMFQVCFALAGLQEYLRLTHNDLHTNNIMWKRTDLEYLHYRIVAGGPVYRVPTYGRVFSLIDYGRSIYTMDNKPTVISSDFYDNNDAAGQYNFGPMMCEDDPQRIPNKSFDLALYACSILRGLFYDNPEGLERGAVLSKDGDWVVRESASVLFNTLWHWLASKEKKPMYETEDGYERWEGFDLYIGLAEHACNAVPAEQFSRAWCKKYVCQGPIVANIPIITL